MDGRKRVNEYMKHIDENRAWLAARCAEPTTDSDPLNVSQPEA